MPTALPYRMRNALPTLLAAACASRDVVPEAAGAGAELVVTPNAVDFGTTYMGCDKVRTLTLTNAGTRELVVSDLTYDSSTSDLTFDTNDATNGPLPWTFAANASADVYVTYTPTSETTATGTLTVTSDDPVEPTATATHEATGALAGEYLDVFVAPYDVVDIVFAVDASPSSAGDVERLEAALPSLVATLADADLDFQVAMVLEDDGCVYGSHPFVDGAVDQEEQVERLVYMLTPEGGEYTEQGFTLLQQALDDTNVGSGGCNEGLLRDAAALVLVGITDDAERSGAAWSTYVEAFQGLKSDPSALTMHAIAGDYPGGCGTADAGSGWYEASALTRGSFLSICAPDWESHFRAFFEHTSAAGEYALSHSSPIPETIVVRVDGVEAEGWTYAETENVIAFAEPLWGSTVEVEYAVFAECD